MRKLIGLDDFCPDTITDGAITYSCCKEKGHKGRHGSSTQADDGRWISIAWTNNSKNIEKGK
jgi:hypothetical protein